jgi:hypothetical protein
MSTKREIIATLLRAGRTDLANAYAGLVTAELPVPVGYFSLYLSHLLTQYDRREMARETKRGNRGNIYRLGHLLGALHKVDAAIKSVKDSKDPKDFEVLRTAVLHEFTDFPPRRALLKALDKYLETGKRPKIA